MCSCCPPETTVYNRALATAWFKNEKNVHAGKIETLDLHSSHDDERDDDDWNLDHGLRRRTLYKKFHIIRKIFLDCGSRSSRSRKMMNMMNKTFILLE